MDPMTMALLGSAAMGLMKGDADAKAAKQQQKVEAERERWSPFTGVHGQNVKKPNMMDPLMQSLLTGAIMGGQFKKGAAGQVGDGTTAGMNAAGQRIPLDGESNFRGPPGPNAVRDVTFGQGDEQDLQAAAAPKKSYLDSLLF